ncbi:hypothetical protein [Acinetobacter sp.]|uniref:hypothetical protein n=1 Tax=Acinetobacter sp. TaxID=472 RepID=UPI000C37765F|nr:hypothetical protein [Acinetobacter sp.]MBC69841.1 hypothetical protein [Acinetobacter sp.]
MSDNRDTFSFIFFDSAYFVAQNLAERKSFISALQDFETTFYEISGSRWLAAIISLHSACEKLLKTVSPKNKMEDLIDDLNIPSRLKEKSHDFRLFRNTIVHEGYKPKDDPKAIKLFFDNGMLLFEHLFRQIVKKDLAETFTKKLYKGEFPLWKIFKKTKNLVQKENFSSEELLVITSILILQCRYLVSMGGPVERTKNNNDFSYKELRIETLSGIENLDEDVRYEDLLIKEGVYFQDDLWEKINFNVLNGICKKLDCKEIFRVDGLDCPVCNGFHDFMRDEIWINLELDEYSMLELKKPFELKEVKSAFCTSCLNGTSNPLLLKHFYSPIKEKSLEDAFECWKEDRSDEIDFFQTK